MDFIFALAITTHIGLMNDYNPVHPHIRLEHNSLITGAYINSLAKPSAYLGISYNITDNFFIDLGGITGYEDFKFFTRAGFTKDNYNIFITPAYEHRNFGIVLGLEHKFKIGD